MRLTAARHYRLTGPLHAIEKLPRLRNSPSLAFGSFDNPFDAVAEIEFSHLALPEAGGAAFIAAVAVKTEDESFGGVWPRDWVNHLVNALPDN